MEGPAWRWHPTGAGHPAVRPGAVRPILRQPDRPPPSRRGRNAGLAVLWSIVRHPRPVHLRRDRRQAGRRSGACPVRPESAQAPRAADPRPALRDRLSRGPRVRQPPLQHAGTDAKVFEIRLDVDKAADATVGGQAACRAGSHPARLDGYPPRSSGHRQIRTGEPAQQRGRLPPLAPRSLSVPAIAASVVRGRSRSRRARTVQGSRPPASVSCARTRRPADSRICLTRSGDTPSSAASSALDRPSALNDDAQNNRRLRSLPARAINRVAAASKSRAHGAWTRSKRSAASWTGDASGALRFSSSAWVRAGCGRYRSSARRAASTISPSVAFKRAVAARRARHVPLRTVREVFPWTSYRWSSPHGHAACGHSSRPRNPAVSSRGHGRCCSVILTFGKCPMWSISRMSRRPRAPRALAGSRGDSPVKCRRRDPGCSREATWRVPRT